MKPEEENKKLLHKIAELETELNNIRNRMQNLQGILLSNISHDIRTPMNAIVGFANLLANEKMNAKDRVDCIDQINTNSVELLKMIDNMIDASLLQCGDLKLYEKECRINDLLDDLYSTYKELNSVKQKKLNLIVSKGKNDDYYLITDYKRLKQVLHNLIGNAIKFTNSGYVEFGYYKFKNKIRFFVKDTGIGIGSLTDKDMFKPFGSRLHSENGSVNKGAGLGLAVSNSLVKLMGGEMWLDSETPGKPMRGTCLYFTLPEKKFFFSKSKLQKIREIAKRNIASFF